VDVSFALDQDGLLDVTACLRNQMEIGVYYDRGGNRRDKLERELEALTIQWYEIKDTFGIGENPTELVFHATAQALNYDNLEEAEKSLKEITEIIREWNRIKRELEALKRRLDEIRETSGSQEESFNDVVKALKKNNLELARNILKNISGMIGDHSPSGKLD
jgi:DNA repair exonuclease SbcCD ATPase subunit